MLCYAMLGYAMLCYAVRVCVNAALRCRKLEWADKNRRRFFPNDDDDKKNRRRFFPNDDDDDDLFLFPSILLGLPLVTTKKRCP
eukprot:1178307-Pyramimonas_sp.AAC.1